LNDANNFFINNFPSMIYIIKKLNNNNSLCGGFLQKLEKSGSAGRWSPTRVITALSEAA
jgi:hypothetical protein